MGNLGIKSRVVLLAVLPVTLIAVWLSYTEITTRFKTLDTSLTMSADTIARNLARSSEVAIVTDNQELLDQLALSTLLEENVLSVHITTHSGTMHTYARQSNDPPASTSSAKIKIGSTSNPPALVFRQPILLARNRSLVDEDLSLLFQSNPLLEPNDIGVVVLEISTTSVELIKREALLTSVLATLLAVSLTIAFGLIIGRAITRPIVELSDAVERIEKGDLDITLKTSSAGELKTLQSGFASMAHTIKASQAALINEVGYATSELRNTLQTVEKQNVALESARQKEQDANRAKSEFLANISHEIRTPMNAVLGFADILNQTHLDEQQAEYIAIIKKSGEHLVHIINDILDLSRIEAGKLSINPVDFNLRSCLEDVIQLLAPQAHENNNELVMLIYNDVPNVINGDPLRIKQIILNLLHNALKFTRSGSVILRIMDEGNDAEVITLGINVEDNGIGIESSDIAKLFTAYSISQHNDERRSGGTGLGLSITDKLVKSMNGTISVESTVKKGTVFHCEIKVHLAKHDTTEAPENKPLLGKHIVIFDDHSVTRLATTHMLNRAGAEKIHAYDCSAIATNQLDDDGVKPDIVILSLPRGSDCGHDKEEILSGLSAIVCETRCLLVPQIEKPELDIYQFFGVDVVINRPVREKNLIASLSRQVIETSNVISLHPSLPSAINGHILVADDHEINLRVVSTLLTRRGHKCTLAHSGSEAITLSEQQTFDMIFMDIHMPGVSGVEAVQRIRSMGNKNQATPIIALTADAISLDLRKLIGMGFNDRLIKPITEDDLFGHVDLWLDLTEALENETHDVIEEDEDEEEAPSLVTELRAMLLIELPENLQQMEIHQKKNDFDAICDLAHRLHGASSYCDWPDLKSASSKLELHILHSKEPAQIAQSAQHLVSTITQLIHDHT